MRRTHICISDKNADLALVKEAARDHKEAAWYVPKTSVPGDRVLIYLHGQGMIATGEIGSEPIPEKDKPGWYVADIEDIQLIEPPISLETLQERIPEWAWTTYPRGYTTPKPEIADKLWKIVESSAGAAEIFFQRNTVAG